MHRSAANPQAADMASPALEEIREFWPPDRCVSRGFPVELHVLAHAHNLTQRGQQRGRGAALRETAQRVAVDVVVADGARCSFGHVAQEIRTRTPGARAFACVGTIDQADGARASALSFPSVRHRRDPGSGYARRRPGRA